MGVSWYPEILKGRAERTRRSDQENRAEKRMTTSICQGLRVFCRVIGGGCDPQTGGIGQEGRAAHQRETTQHLSRSATSPRPAQGITRRVSRKCRGEASAIAAA